MTHERNKRILAAYILTVAVLLMLFFVFPAGNLKRSDALALITFFVNGAIWLLLLIVEIGNRPFSLQMFHWSFCLLFFFFAALVQYVYDEFPWSSDLSDIDVQNANFLLVLWTAGTCAGIYFAKRSSHKVIITIRNTTLIGENRNYMLDSNRLVRPLTVINLCILLQRVFTIGVVNLLSRATSGYAYAGSSSMSMLIEQVLQAISYFSTVIAILNCKENHNMGKGYAIANFCFLLVSYFPSGMARYAAAAIYLGVLFTLSDKLKTGRCFPFLFLIGFLLILPVLNTFRYAAFDLAALSESFRNLIANLSTEWLSGDYDAYKMFALSIKDVAMRGSTHGRQFLGVLLFWVPRTFWSAKPVGSGYTIAKNLGWTFRNVSCPLPGEGYINGGIIGMFLFAIFVGFIMQKVDLWYWNTLDLEGHEVRSADVIYPVVAVFSFFISRGDLLSSFAYVAAYITVGCILCGLMKCEEGRA